MKGAAGAALEQLERAERFARRLGRAAPSADDLHGFRVGTRRLLAHVKAHDLVSRKTRKRLRRAFRATGPARDTQVEADWLRRRARLWRKGRSDAAALIARLEPGASLDPAWARDFREAAKRARRELEDAGPRGREEQAFQRAAAKKARRQARRLRDRLARLERAADAVSLHRARVAAKRLRYLAEPLRDPAGLPPLKDLKRLQGLLGDIHDRDVIETRLNRLRARDPALGLTAARAIAQARREKAALRARADFKTLARSVRQALDRA